MPLMEDPVNEMEALLDLSRAVMNWQDHKNNLGKSRKSPQRQIARYNAVAHQAAEAAERYVERVLMRRGESD